MTNNNEEKPKKMGFIKRVIISIKDFEKYIEFAIEKTTTAIGYLAKLIVIFAIIVSATFTYHFVKEIQSGVKYFKEELPDLSYQDGELVVQAQEAIKIENDNSILQFMLIDTNANEEQQNEYKKEVAGYNNGVVILKDKLILKNAMLKEPVEYSYKELAQQYGISNFKKEEAVKVIEETDTTALYGGFFLTMVIYLFFVYFITAILDAFSFFILGLIVSRMVSIKIKLKPIFNMAVYSLTLPILLNLIYIVVKTFTGFTIQYFQWMYIAIASIYMIVAILMIKADFINKQKELMKIVEEQEKVRQEIQEREAREKEKRQKEEQKKKEKEEEKQEKRKEKENNLGEEPEGSKA